MSSRNRKPPSRRGNKGLMYHYTNRDGIIGILRDGIIRASSTTIHDRPIPTRDSAIWATPPAVWFSTHPIIDMIIYRKALWSYNDVPWGKIFRVSVPQGYGGSLDLLDYTLAVGIPPEDWDIAVQVGHLAGSHHSTWRVVQRDVPRRDWSGVEQLTGLAYEGFTWSRIEDGPLPVPEGESRFVEVQRYLEGLKGAYDRWSREYDRVHDD